MIASSEDQTIIAQCTPRGNGALALIRISGVDALIIAASLTQLRSKQSILDVPTHTVHYGSIVDKDGTTIDHVMAIVMHGPKTFTGQNTIEITCHNNQFLIAAIIQQAVFHGARLAQEGEFSQRAFMNRKIDLVQAESINELIHASTQMALKQSLAQLEGSFSQWLQSLEQELMKTIAYSEASFEFIDEEMEFGQKINESIHEILKKITALKKTFDQQQQIRQGVRIALIGSVNAGKSSLFNALLGKNRSIVTAIAGTTRDVVEAGMYQNSSYWTLIDTAGLRQTNDIVEQEGIDRSHQEAQLADCILLVHDGSQSLTAYEDAIYRDLQQRYAHKIIILYTKADLPSNRSVQPQTLPTLSVSIHDKSSIIRLEKMIEEKLYADLFKNIESPFLLNQRQFNLLLSLEKSLLFVRDILVDPIPYELVSFHLKDGLEKLTELSGKTITDQSMDAIFRQFCIGK